MREDPFKNVNVKGVNAFVSFLKKLIAVVSLYHILVIIGAAIFAFGIFYAISAARPETLQYLKRQYKKDFVIESKEINEKRDGTYIVYPKDTPELKVTVTRYRYKYQDNYEEQLIEYYYEKEKNSELFSGFNIVRRDTQKDIMLEKNVYSIQEFKDTARQIYDLKIFFKEKSPNFEYNVPIGMKYGNYTTYLWIQDAAGDKENLVKKAMKDYISYLKNNNYSLSEISDEDLSLWSPNELDIKINGTYVKDYTGETNCKMVFLTEKQEHVIFLYQIFNYIDGVNILKKEKNMVKEFQYNGKDYIITSGMKPWFRDITKINAYVTIDELKEIFNASVELDYENAIVNINIREDKRMNIKKENGITLIALIITIIVLLILAGVAINAITGENGILSQAQKANDKTSESEIIERVQIIYMSSYDVTTGKLDSEQFIEKIANTFENEDYDIIENYNGSFTIKVNDNEVYIKENGQIVEPSDMDVSADSIVLGDIWWYNNKAYIRIDSESGADVEYQVNGIIEGEWSNGNDIENLSHGDILFVRLTNGTDEGEYINIDIAKDGEDNIDDFEITEITKNSVTVQISTPSSSDNCRYEYYLNGSLLATATITNLTDVDGNITKQYGYVSNNAGKTSFTQTQTGPYGVLKYIALNSNTEYTISIYAYDAIGSLNAKKNIKIATK